MSQVGIDHATDAGVVAPLPVVLLPLALLGTASVAVHWRRDVRILVVSGMVLVTAASAPALAAAVGIPVTLYYPSKLLWSAGALGLLPLATMTARGVDLLWRLGGAARLAVRSVIVAVSGLLLSLCAVNPASAVFFWDTVDGTRVLKTLTAPNAGTAQVVWLPGELSESTITRILLDFYRVGHHDGYLPQQPLDAEQECGVLRQFVRPAVLSSAPPAVVLARYECVPDLRVVPAVNEARR